MRDLYCPACEGESADGLLCRECTGRLRTHLGHLPANLRDLADVVTRNVARGKGVGGKGTETPLPFNPAASDLQWEVRNTLSTWARDLDMGDLAVEKWARVVNLRKGGPQFGRALRPGPMPDDPGTWARWIISRMERVRGHPAAGEMWSELMDVCHRVRRAIDLPPELEILGDCPTCGQVMHARPLAVEATCRKCKAAGVEEVHDATALRARLTERVHEEMVPRTVVLRVLAQLGMEVNPATFRQWVSRGRITAHDQEDGRKLYRVGDVVALATDARVGA